MIYDIQEHQVTNAQRQWRTICGSSDLTHLFATAGSGYASISHDGGATWVECTALGATGSVLQTCSAMSADGSKIMVCKPSGYIYVSSDYGVTWSSYSGTGNRTWGGAWMSQNGQIMYAAPSAGGGYFGLLKSSNGGVTWTTVGGSTASSTSINNSAGRIAASQDGQYIVLLDGSTPKRSTDGGNSWTVLTSLGSVANVAAVRASLDGSRFYIGRLSINTLLESLDYGATWSSITASTSYGNAFSTSDSCQIQIYSLSGVVAAYVSSDYGQSRVIQSYLGSRSWYEFALSYDGTKFAGTVSTGYIYTGQEYPSLTLTSVSPNHGYLAGGTALTFIGTGFIPTTVIKIDGNPITNTIFYDSTTITGSAPAGASVGPKSITAVNP